MSARASTVLPVPRSPDRQMQSPVRANSASSPPSAAVSASERETSSHIASAWPSMNRLLDTRGGPAADGFVGLTDGPWPTGREPADDGGSPVRLRLQLDGTPVQLDEALHQRQAKSRSPVPRAGRTRLEPIENLVEVLRIDAASGIRHPQHDIAVVAIRAQRDRVSRRTEADGVGQ